jgi:predicted porin
MRQVVVCAFSLLALTDAAAQSSTRLYGIVDVAIDHVSSAKPDGGSLTRVSSGGANTSRWGIRGKEELGGGLAAVYQLEGTLLVDTGSSDGALFKRQANVGLEGQFGRVVFGRSFTTVHDLVTVYDPLALAQFYSWAVSASATGPNKYSYTTSFDNMVKYLGTFGPVQLGVNYGFGEQAGAARDSAKVALSLALRFDALSWMATWEQINGNQVVSGGRRERNTVGHVGAIYQQGAFKWTVVARQYKLVSANPLIRDVAATTSWAGVNYTLGAATLTAVLYHVNVRQVAAGADADPTMAVLSYRYALSPRFDVYTAVARSKARNGLPAGVLRDIPGYANSQRGMVVGMQY